MNAELYMTLANIVFLCGTSFLFIKIVKNRNSIKDFDKSGSFLTFVGMCFASLSMFELKMFTAILFSIPTLLFWLFAFIFSVKSHK